MLKKLMVVGGGALSSRLNAPKTLKNNRFCFKIKLKAFSVAEVAIALLIGSIMLGMAAPMITKQMKNENIESVQIEILKKTIIPSGAIMFFDRADCPDGWDPLNSKYNGRYFKVAGNYTICDKDGENSDGTCVGSAAVTVTDNNRGVFSGDAIRNIEGHFSSYEMGRYGVSTYTSGPFTVTNGTAHGASEHSGTNPVFWFDASRVVPTADENRPRSVSMLACVKK